MSSKSWRGCNATLTKDSPFQVIFPYGVPIKSMLPSKVKLVGDSESEAYLLAWNGCSDDQKIAIAKTVTDLRGGTVDEFLTYMNRGGDMPIRASQVTSASAPLALFL